MTALVTAVFHLWRESRRECSKKKGTGKTWFYLRSEYQLEMAPPSGTYVLGELFPCGHASSLPLRSKPCAEQSMANTKWTQQWFCRLLVSYCFIWVFLFGWFGFCPTSLLLEYWLWFPILCFMVLFMCVTCFYFFFKIPIYFLFVF